MKFQVSIKMNQLIHICQGGCPNSQKLLGDENVSKIGYSLVICISAQNYTFYFLFLLACNIVSSQFTLK